MVALSGCLIGLSCRFDGRSKTAHDLLVSLKGACIVPLCPEQLGGLPTPRPAAHFVGGSGREVLAGTAQVVNARGEDVTGAYLRGAREMVKICQLLNIRRAFLREKSPACGTRLVTVEGRLTAGMGVAAAMLRRAHVELVGVP
jgi:uncharacterized protein YbbK (DUF523 family)